jgi:methionyl-tRNA formyltransferase
VFDRLLEDHRRREHQKQQIREQKMLETHEGGDMGAISTIEGGGAQSNRTVDIRATRNHEQFLEDQLHHETLRIKRHREAVERAMKEENATFAPQLSKKTIELTWQSERIAETRNSMPLH